MRKHFNFINSFAVFVFTVVVVWFFMAVPDRYNVSETFKSIIVLIVGYFFGSSKSSAIKNDTLNEAVKNQGTVKTDNIETVNTNSVTLSTPDEKKDGE